MPTSFRINIRNYRLAIPTSTGSHPGMRTPVIDNLYLDRHEAVRVLKGARRFLRWATPLPSRVEMVVFAGRWFK